ncbi:hypothetical protein D3C80_1806980 [compost metagenome]
MNSTGNGVRPAAPALHNINFTGSGPVAILIVFRQHPDGRPQAFTGRCFCPDLKLAVFLAEQPLGLDP